MTGYPPCPARCSHGGWCELTRGHDGQHNSGYCQFTDEQALSIEQADAVFLAKNPGQDWIPEVLTAWDRATAEVQP